MAWGKRIEPFQAPAQSAGDYVAPRAEAAAATNRDATNRDGSEESPDHCVGKSVQIKGDLTGDEDVRVDGRFEGTIRLAQHRLVVGRTGRVQAEVEAREVIVEGQIVGDVTASDRVVITATGSVSGNLCAGRLILAEGGILKGSVEMEVPVIEPSNSSPLPPAAAPSPSPSPSSSSPSPTPSYSPTPSHSSTPRAAPSYATPASSTPLPSIAEPRDEGNFENAFPTIFDEKS
jgi:cytoskeletal protein CcmA (bactofilin family)